MTSLYHNLILEYWKVTRPQEVETLQQHGQLSARLREEETLVLDALTAITLGLKQEQPLLAGATYQQRLVWENQIRDQAHDLVRDRFCPSPEPTETEAGTPPA